MKTARMLLAASAALLALGLVASAWAAPGPDGGSESGGARALPVVPSGGGGSEPGPDLSAQLGSTDGELPQTTPVMPPLEGVPGALPDDTGTLPGQDVIVPLETAPGEENPPLIDSSGGGFGFLAGTGSEIVSLITAGVEALTGGMLSAFSGSSP
jgi:hypothetical protein